MTTFAQTIREARLDAGLTQLEVAQRAGLTERYINGIERGGPCGTEAARDICDALNVPRHWAARSYLERYAAKQQRLHGTPPSQTLAELARALHDNPGESYIVFESGAVDEPSTV